MVSTITSIDRQPGQRPGRGRGSSSSNHDGATSQQDHRAPTVIDSENITAGAATRTSQPEDHRAQIRTESKQEQEPEQEEKNILLTMEAEGDSCPSEDHILDNAIEYRLSGTYPPSREKRRKEP